THCLTFDYGQRHAIEIKAAIKVSASLSASSHHVIKLDAAGFGGSSLTGEGEIQAQGPNIMRGYYKAENLTSEAFTEDGWFRTGDLGSFDKDNFLRIKGRIKTMIVSASGENIYPEEIESVINRMRFVLESLVVEKKGRLVALIHLNSEEIEQQLKTFKQDAEDFAERFTQRKNEILSEIQEKVNAQVNKFSRVQVVSQQSPFEKTPTHKIKRFLYKDFYIKKP
ncbi:MAG: AMP-binding protein, partial [Prolixibacteraceae bacterium]|nr:AMP-binding protein [Prolixibacteraceae bacterium]